MLNFVLDGVSLAADAVVLILGVDLALQIVKAKFW